MRWQFDAEDQVWHAERRGHRGSVAAGVHFVGGLYFPSAARFQVKGAMEDEEEVAGMHAREGMPTLSEALRVAEAWLILLVA